MEKIINAFNDALSFAYDNILSVAMMVLLILALMTVVGSFLINGVGNYYIDDFYVQMEQTFSQKFITQLQQLADDADAGKMTQVKKQLRLLVKYNLSTYVTEENLPLVQQDISRVKPVRTA